MANDNIVLNADVSPAIRELDKLVTKVGQLHDKFKDQFEKINGYTVKLGAALIATGVAVAAFADDITDIADANQVAISSVLGLSKALEASGGKADNVGKLFQTLSNNIEEANAGNLKTANTFQRLGVSIEDLGNLSNTALKDKVLSGLVAIRDPIEKNALAMQVFGKSMVGVDIDKFAASQRQMIAEMAPYAASIKTAGDAWDNVVSILGKIKLAFAEAFEPVFKIIANLNVNIDLLVVGFRLLGAALVVMTGASVIGGLMKLVELMKVLTLVVSRNPLIAIAGALVSLGIGAATYLGLGKSIEDQQAAITGELDATNEASLNGKRNQEGIYEALKKQRDSLTQIREDLEKSWQKSLEKYNLELDLLKLGDDQKRVAQELAKIDEEKVAKLDELAKKYEGMDKDARARNKATYDEERTLIEKSAESAKKAAEIKIKGIQDYQNVVKKFQGINQQAVEGEQRIFEALAKQKVDNAGYLERIGLEEKINEIQRIRSELNANTSSLSAEDKASALKFISDEVNNAELLSMTYQEIGQTIDENIRKSGLSAEAIKTLLGTTDKGFGMIATSAEAVANINQRIGAESRTFSAGWNKAFRDYADNAFNAAEEARRVFQIAAQGMEDALMNFIKRGKFEWKNFVQLMVDELLRSQIRQLIGNLGNLGSQASAGIGGMVGKLLGFANGGIIPTNGPVIVGERGPELLMGAAGMSVTPNSQLGGSTNVVYNINAVDAMSFKQMIARDPSFLYAVAEQGRRRLPGGR